MANILTIPRSNVLRFVNMENYETNIQNFDNTLLADELWNQEEVHPYFQKFSYNDDIKLQLISNYPTIQVRFYDLDDYLIGTMALSSVYSYTDTSGNVVYEGTYDVGTTERYLYCTIVASGSGRPTLTFRSEVIHISDYSDLPFIQWAIADNDGIYWGNDIVFGMRCEMLMSPYKPEIEETKYEGYASQLINLKTIPKRLIDAECDFLPRYMAEKLSLALCHEEFYVNSIRYTAKEAAKILLIKNTNLFEFSVTLQEYDYEDYSSFTDLGGIPPVVIDRTWDYNGEEWAYSSTENYNYY